MNDKTLDNNALGEKSKLECLRLISDGSGIGYMNGIATFVPGLLPGETGEIIVYVTKKKWQRARLQRIIKTSPERIDAPCSVFKAVSYTHLTLPTNREV